MSAPNASGWKPGTPLSDGAEAPATLTGNRALMLEEPLIFEIGTTRTTGVDLPEPSSGANRLGNFARTEEFGLPGLSEPETVRCGTTPASAARTTPSISGCFRSAAAR